MLGKLFAQLVSKIFNLCGPDPATSQTDGQMTCDRKTALCTIVHRAVKNLAIGTRRQVQGVHVHSTRGLK